MTHSSKTRVDVKCDYCGDIYNTSYGVYYHAHQKFPKDCCSKCTGKKTAEVTLDKRRNKYWCQLQEFCDTKNYTLITQKEDYIDVKMNIEYICPKHGKVNNMLDNMLHGYGCWACGREISKIKSTFDKDFVEEYVNSINGNKLLNKEEYLGTFIPNLKIRCKCGNIFITSFNNYKKSTNTCRKCSLKESRGEAIIRHVLEYGKIKFEQEKRFSDCRDKKPLPFDFYLPDYNLCIEYDGEQHYKDISFNGVTSYLERNQKHDKIKNEYCNEHNINLLRIPYWEVNNIKNIILEKLKEM